jgi:UDPglucose 6-dehydrogenase
MKDTKSTSESVLVIGAGTVGFAKGVAFEDHGHRVRFVDTSPSRRADLRSSGFSCDSEYHLSDESHVIFLCVPTPASVSGYDLSILRIAVERLALKLKESSGRHLIVLCSTVPPGTTSTLVVPLLASGSGLEAGVGFHVAVVPEFIRESHASNDAQHPWITVIASPDDVAVARLTALFGPFGGLLRTFSDPTIAELIKVTHNAFNATKISFFNEMHLLATSMGVDGHAVGEVVSKSAEGSFNADYGIRGGAAFVGQCLPKDLDGLIAFANGRGVAVSLLEGTRAVNKSFGAEDLAQEYEPVQERLSEFSS